MQYSYLGGNIIIHFKSLAPGFEAYQLVETMIKVCQLCNAIYAPITYIFSSVVLHQKWLKLPLPVESRLKKNRKKVEQSALERCERVKELFSRVSHPAEKSKKEDLSLSAGFCFRSNSQNVFISRMNSSRKKTYLEIHHKLQNKSSKFNLKMETQPKSNILEIHSKYENIENPGN